MRPVVLFAVAAAAAVALVATTWRPKRTSGFQNEAGAVELAGTELRLTTPSAVFVLEADRAAGARVGSVREVRDAKGTLLDGVAIAGTLDGAPARLEVEPPEATPNAPTHARARGRLSADGRAVDVEVGYTLARAPVGLWLSLRSLSAEPHLVGISVTMPASGHPLFARGLGMLSDSTDASTEGLVAEIGDRAVAVAVSGGDAAVRVGLAREEAGAPLVATMTARAATSGEPSRIVLAPAASPSAAHEAVARARGETLRRVAGVVLGAAGPVRVWGIGADGRPVLRVDPEPGGAFDLFAPPAAVGFYATTAHMRASPIVSRPPGDDARIELTVHPGGDARVRVRDADTGEALTSRIIVHGVPPTADPNFGPDYRASGAGPLLDALRGEAVVSLPTGRYRVLATHGPEYTIDERTIDVGPATSQELSLALRHVVDTPGAVGCDFHVHARPSFDSPVLPEDRVLSLVAVGVDFAVPSEHNVVGHYDAAIESQGLGKSFASVPGVEITTVDPRRGHFNVYPYTEPDAPPYRRKALKEIFAAARGGDPSRVLQVNHPRMSPGLGYFDLVGLDTKTGSTERGEYRSDYDALEVYNGVEAADRAHVEAVLRDWLRLLERGKRYVATGDSDSHRIQYAWAGYPRTYVLLSPEEAGDGGGPIDTRALVASLKQGRATVTSGPMLDATIDGKGPGATAAAREGGVRLHVRVRAAPWVDVDDLEVFVGTVSAARRAIAPSPLVIGAPQGDLASARASAVRFEEDLEIAVPPAGGPVVVVARGSRKLDDVLPHMPIQPLAFTNPIWIDRR